MKKTLLSIIYLLAFALCAKAQVLYGTTLNGGNDGVGTIIKFTLATNDLKVTKSFESIAYEPYGSLIQATDGKFYGMTYSGGIGYGAIFSFDPSSFTYTKLKDFDDNSGRQPRGSLIQASDGKLYGMTTYGGSNGGGVIFSFDPSTSIYIKLKDFDYTDGNPYGSLVQANDGKLYGMSDFGGSNHAGIIFSFDPSTSIYTKLKDFAGGIDGGYPVGSLLQASDGKLYGMTPFGGSSDSGVIFSYTPSDGTYKKLKDFDNTNGGRPFGSLFQASDGKLYGMAAGGGSSNAGVIFSFNPSGSVYSKLKDFNYPTGGSPQGSLMQANDGKLYGMTPSGGSFDYGVIFSFDPLASTYSKLKDFDGTTDGSFPNSSLIQASDGNLYGLTPWGGVGNSGVIFSFSPSTYAYSLIKQFGINETGANPYGSLMKASDGKLYGMTRYGGSSDAGIIFSFDPSTSTYTKLKDFDNANGASPLGSLIQASDGKLYGMTYGGGSNYVGVIFSFDLSASIYTKLKDFDNTNGTYPFGNLMQASNGKLYGMTPYGGSGGFGVIFSFDPSTSTYTKLKDFDNTNGANPVGSLMQASNGKLYGMTYRGESSDAGVIFSFDPSTSTYSKLKDFDITNGRWPQGSLMQASNGKLYGMTSFGGSSDAGVIFSFDPLASTYTKLKDFDNTNGSKPYGNLMQAQDGKLYGTTYTGGSSDVGVIFSFDPSASTYSKLQDFDNVNGANPFRVSFIEVPESGPVPVTLISLSGKNNGTSNLLYWKVENEQNLNYYELQRSIDGQNFKGISQIKATGNNTYSYNDNIADAVSFINYYRLKSVDNDGHFKYSVVIKIITGLNGTFVTINPNPFKDRLIVTVESLIVGKATFIITDLGGRQLYKENKQLSAGTNVVSINEVRKLSKGTYLLTIITSQQTQSMKVIKGN